MAKKRTYRRPIKLECDQSKRITEQAHKHECDMNYILRNYQKTGLIRHAKKYEGTYDDVSVQDFQEAMFLVNQAQQSFMDLPSNVRARFENNPAKFLEFTQNPANRDEMAAMGILKGNDGLDRTGAPTDAPTPPPAEPAA